MTPVPVHLDAAALDALGIGPQEAVQAIRDAVRASEAGTLRTAPKSGLRPPDGRYVMTTLAAMDDPPVVAVKALVLNPENPRLGLPEINGVVTLIDSRTGLPLATLDGNWITAIRTAALSATAASYMARPEAARIGFLGSGVQARSHLNALAGLFPLTGIRVFGRGGANLAAFTALAARLGIAAEPAATPGEAVDGADIVVSALSASGGLPPFSDTAAVAPGAFVAMADLGRAWRPEALAGFDRIVIDDLAQEGAMADPLVPPDLVTGDLADLVTGRIAGRTAASDRTAFVFRGNALGDLALAALAWRRHLGRGTGANGA